MMSDLILVTDEQAKAIQEALKFGTQSLETARAFGAYVAGIFGTVPDDIVGLVFGDALRLKRAENIVRLIRRSGALLDARNITTREDVPLSLGLPLLTAAAEENREELVDLWARLLAAAMDPSRSNRVRQNFIKVVKEMDPLDALVFKGLAGPSDMQPTVRDFMAAKLNVGPDQVEVSLVNLYELDCVFMPNVAPAVKTPPLSNVSLTAFGRELLTVLLGYRPRFIQAIRGINGTPHAVPATR